MRKFSWMALPVHRRMALASLCAVVLAACQSSDPPPAGSGSSGSASNAALKSVAITTSLQQPWSLAFLPDGRMLVTEKSGQLRVIDTLGAVSAPIGGIPAVADAGQGGLLDIALSPSFAADRRIYFTFSEPVAGGLARTAVASGLFADTGVTDVQVIFRQDPPQSTSLHFGSRLVFDAQGFLFVTLGERGMQDLAQPTDNHLGKVIRINTNGSAPADNPFVGNGTAKAEIYSYGHRNPQGAAIHPQTGRLWVVEHGPQGGDELNQIVAGANFGWPRITYGVNYGTGTAIGEGTTAADVEPPRHYWVPISIAPSNMVFYTGDKVPSLTGSLLVGALAATCLVKLEMSGDQIVGESRLLANLNERIRDVRQGPDGYPYVLTDSGKLLRIETQ